MNDGLDLLRTLVDEARPTSRAARLTSNCLRFVLEYRERIDLATERRRIADTLEIDVARLRLVPVVRARNLGEHDFVELQFPGLEATITRRARFAIAYRLTDALGVESAEPELDLANFVAEPDADSTGAAEGVIGDFFSRFCFVGGDGPPDRAWVLKALRLEAEPVPPGERIRIGQPDSGVTKHRELAGAHIIVELGANFVEGGSDPTDRLSGANGGHGTGTGSVIVSPSHGTVTGVAAGAELVPIRCIKDVKVFNAGPVAAAIDHAHRVGCDIITMSLGGVPSAAMHTAIRRAVADGVIVLAAAGNCVRYVVWPARYDEVIAVAAVNIADRPWRGSCRGDAVDVAAPGEKVWRAAIPPRDDPARDVAPGQGTSFAVALTAGVAARWLALHGRTACRAEAARRGLTVQELFRQELVASCRRPPGWDSDFGRGIVDATALLARPLVPAQSPGGTEPGTTEAAATKEGGAGATEVLAATARPDLDSLVAEQVGQPPQVPFAWQRFGLETAAAGVLDMINGVPEAGGEAGGTLISAELAGALATTGDPSLGALAARRRAAPTDLVAGHRPASDDLVRVLGAGGGTPFESGGHVTLAAARAGLSDAVKTRKIDRLRAVEAARSTPTASLAVHAERALDTLLRGGELDEFDLDGRTAIEALVRLEGRPVLPVTDNGFDLDSPLLGDWQSIVALVADALDQASKSVGRIDSAGVHVGSGFVIGDGLVLTNRHVLQELAAPVPDSRTPRRWIFESPATISFDPLAQDPARRFEIRSVIFAGPAPILRSPLDLRKLDLAVIEVAPTSEQGLPLPDPIRIASDHGVGAAAKLFVLGYPAMPSQLPRDDQGSPRSDVVARLRQLFGLTYGVQYLSPGCVIATGPKLKRNSRRWAFTHDATSLAGNSGSCVLGLDAQLRAVGLHFAGAWLDANFAHDLTASTLRQYLPPTVSAAMV